jgi:CDP-diacylglycerol--glycerol-3-phosphate 3-phosphatidyltransferase
VAVDATGNLQVARRALGRFFTDPVVKVLRKTRITPDGLTWAGAFIACGAGALAGLGHLFAAGWVLGFSGIFDLLDGALARAIGRITRFGGVLDSTLDRVSEAGILVGLLAWYLTQNSMPGVLVVGVCMVGSQLVSYIRARAEGLGIKCEVGIFTRPERVIILSLGLLFSRFGPVLLVALIIITVLSWVTAGQRLFHVWRQTKSD